MVRVEKLLAIADALDVSVKGQRSVFLRARKPQFDLGRLLDLEREQCVQGVGFALHSGFLDVGRSRRAALVVGSVPLCVVVDRRECFEVLKVRESLRKKAFQGRALDRTFQRTHQ